MHLDLFVVDKGATVQKFVQDTIELPRHSVLQVVAVNRILLHLSKAVALDDEAEEAVVGLFEALEIVLEYFVLGFEHLNFPEGESSVEAVRYLIQVEHLLVYRLDVQPLDQRCQVFFGEGERMR